jgi:hypothetical protein
MTGQIPGNFKLQPINNVADGTRINKEIKNLFK